MRNGKNTNSCMYGEELVAYIYDELSSPERISVEDHLVSCSGCTAEFADISMSRLGVFEWHRDEFATLATPRFAIPYEQKAIESARRLSWIDALRGLVASPLRVAFAGGSLAAVAIAVGLILALNSVHGVDDAVSKVESVPPVAIPQKDQPPPPVLEKTVVEIPDENATESREYRHVEPSRRIRVIQAKSTSLRKNVQTVTTSAQNVPRLGNFVEAEDSSLRLSDLVADIDTRDF